MAMYSAVKQDRYAFAHAYFQGRIQNGEDYDLEAYRTAQTMGNVLYRLNPNGTTAPVTIPMPLPFPADFEPFARCLLEDSNNPLRDSMKQKEKWLRNPDQLYDMISSSFPLPNFVNAMNTYRTTCQGLAHASPIFKGGGMLTLMEFGVRSIIDEDRVMSMEMVDTLRNWQEMNEVDEDDAIFYGYTYANAKNAVEDIMEHHFVFDIMNGVFCAYNV